MTKEEISAGMALLEKYRAGKQALESRIVENEQWWKLRHRPAEGESVSAWLFNCLMNKHADAMDNYPRPIVLPREKGDSEDAKMLSAILPLVLEENGFEETYDRCWWQKLKNGTGCYGVFWDSGKQNGLGDIAIRRIDLLNLFWEPGVNDLQQSPHLFHVELWDNTALRSAFPVLKDAPLGQSGFTVSRYLYDDTVDTSDKTPVIDWYTREEIGGRTVVHFAKIAAGVCLYDSREQAETAERGYYDHGLYPFVTDVLFPEEGSPAGFGYVDVLKSAQTYTDTLNNIILRNAVMTGRKRFFLRQDGSVNEAEFADWGRDFVHVAGSLDEESIREITVSPLDSFVMAALSGKVEEMKETAGNRDFSQGGTAGGVTAASAISALQEAGNKLTRDMIKASYRAFSAVCRLCVELIRQFYTEGRYFRILGEDGETDFVSYDNRRIREDRFCRAPVFDLRILSEKSSPFTRMTQNEMAKEFYALGFFDPARADAALLCLDMMDFEGREQLKSRIRAGREVMANE